MIQHCPWVAGNGFERCPKNNENTQLFGFSLSIHPTGSLIVMGPDNSSSKVSEPFHNILLFK